VKVEGLHELLSALYLSYFAADTNANRISTYKDEKERMEMHKSTFKLSDSHDETYYGHSEEC